MKEKITNALKTEYAKLGLGERAFDGVASFLAKTITKEDEIDGVIKSEDTKSLLKAFQGESDRLRNRAAQLEKDFNAYKELHPDGEKAGADGDKPDPDGKDDRLSALQEKIDALVKRLDEKDAQSKAAATLESVKAAAKTAGCTDEKVFKLTARLFSLKEGETEEDAAKRFRQEYDAAAKEYFGDGVTPFVQSGAGAPTGDEQFHASMKAYADAKFPESTSK